MNMPESEQIIQGAASHAIKEWLFFILRFAITLDEVDRTSVLAMAADMDRRGSDFTFFARTSVAVCDAIVAKDRPEANAALHGFVRAIGHAPLRRAFEAVLEIKPSGTDRRLVSARSREKLWQGLPTRAA
jgi:hypothetical protein